MRRSFGADFKAIVEWPEGTTPSGSLRTGLESLPSSGSYYSSLRIEDSPMGKQIWFLARNAPQPLRCPPTMSFKTLVFSCHPNLQSAI